MTKRGKIIQFGQAQRYSNIKGNGLLFWQIRVNYRDTVTFNMSMNLKYNGK